MWFDQLQCTEKLNFQWCITDQRKVVMCFNLYCFCFFLKPK